MFYTKKIINKVEQQLWDFMKKILFTIILSAHVGLSCANAFNNNDRGKKFYDNSEQGWFFYNEEEVIEEEEILKEEQAFVPPPPPKEEPKEEPPAEPVDIDVPFGVEWTKKNLITLREAAWDKPTTENMKAYLYLQRYSIDKAEEFSDMYELTTIGDPILDEINKNPTTSAMAEEQRIKNAKKVPDVLKKMSEDVGIFFFFSSDCDSCEAMSYIVQMISVDIHFKIIPVSTDGKPLQNNFFEYYKEDKGQAEMLDVQTLPALFLGDASGKFESVAQGPIGLEELYNRLLLVGKRGGWISEDSYNSTRPMNNRDYSIAEKLTGNSSKEELISLMDENGEVSQEKLIKFIKEKMGRKE